jgi:hypothetical protein
MTVIGADAGMGMVFSFLAGRPDRYGNRADRHRRPGGVGLEAATSPVAGVESQRRSDTAADACTIRGRARRRADLPLNRPVPNRLAITDIVLTAGLAAPEFPGRRQ